MAEPNELFFGPVSPPPAKMRQQCVERLAGYRLVREMAHSANRLAHLVQVNLAERTAREVFLETMERDSGHRRGRSPSADRLRALQLDQRSSRRS